MSAFADPQPEECECCQWKTTELVKCDAYARTHGHGPFTPAEDKQWAWLCLVCRSTFAGNTYLYPRNYSYDTHVIGATVCWGINAILDALHSQVATP